MKNIEQVKVGEYAWIAKYDTDTTWHAFHRYGVKRSGLTYEQAMELACKWNEYYTEEANKNKNKRRNK